jgi:uncharacterized protein YfaT (DUF1175 family)
VRCVLPFRLWPRCAVISVVLVLAGYAGLSQRRESFSAERLKNPASAARTSLLSPVSGALPEPETSSDRLGDGFPDAARLDLAADRENFTRWLTFLAEALYYHPAPRALAEVQDCAALIRYAYRNALVAHTSAWRQAADLPYEPGFGDVRKFAYPDWPLGRGLFRTRAGPLSPRDFADGAFAEFADAATLLQYNTFPVSREARAARPGDLLFFLQPTQQEPYHVILFVGQSHFQPHDTDWIIYHTGDLDGQRGEIRHLRASLLMEHPDPRWRPLEANPRFLGVYRFNLLR